MLEKFREDIISLSGIRDNKKNYKFFFDETKIFKLKKRGGINNAGKI